MGKRQLYPEEILYNRIYKVLKENDALCMDNEAERMKLALALQYELTDDKSRSIPPERVKVI